MKTLLEDEPEKYQTHFSLYAKKGIDADNIEELYKKVHAAIRADPTAKKSEKQPPKERKSMPPTQWFSHSLRLMEKKRRGPCFYRPDKRCQWKLLQVGYWLRKSPTVCRC